MATATRAKSTVQILYIFCYLFSPLDLLPTEITNSDRRCRTMLSTMWVRSKIASTTLFVSAPSQDPSSIVSAALSRTSAQYIWRQPIPSARWLASHPLDATGELTRCVRRRAERLAEVHNLESVRDFKKKKKKNITKLQSKRSYSVDQSATSRGGRGAGTDHLSLIR